MNIQEFLDACEQYKNKLENAAKSSLATKNTLIDALKTRLNRVIDLFNDDTSLSRDRLLAIANLKSSFDEALAHVPTVRSIFGARRDAKNGHMSLNLILAEYSKDKTFSQTLSKWESMAIKELNRPHYEGEGNTTLYHYQPYKRYKK